MLNFPLSSLNLQNNNFARCLALLQTKSNSAVAIVVLVKKHNIGPGHSFQIPCLNTYQLWQYPTSLTLVHGQFPHLARLTLHPSPFFALHQALRKYLAICFATVCCIVAVRLTVQYALIQDISQFTFHIFCPVPTEPCPQ